MEGLRVRENLESSWKIFGLSRRNVWVRVGEGLTFWGFF